MQPADFYQSILDSLTDDLERKVFQVLSDHFGLPITRVEIISLVYGIDIEKAKLSDSRQDRAIRKCIENLRSKDYPIVASSGEAGYFLTDNQNEIDACVAEERARVRNIEKKIEHMQRSRRLAHDLHLWRRGAQLPVQLKLV
jgi:hypothetical protein